MKPLFTIHGGEQLVGEYIEREFKNVNLWLPTRDTGIDLLVTSRDNKKAISLQVKYSKDFQMSHIDEGMRRHAIAYGWWTFDRRKLRNSIADYWVLVLLPFAHRKPQFLIAKPKDLAERYDALQPGEKRSRHIFGSPTSGDVLKPEGLGRMRCIARFKGTRLTRSEISPAGMKSGNRFSP